MKKTVLNNVKKAIKESTVIAASKAVKKAAGKSVLFGAKAKPVSHAVRAALEANGCWSEDWSRVKAVSDFDPVRVWRSGLLGDVVLGAFTGTSQPEKGVTFANGVYDSVVSNCEIADALVYSVKMLSNYIVKPGAVIANCGTVAVTGETAFGNGNELSIAIETGGRETRIFGEMSCVDAEWVGRSRDDKAFLEEYSKLVDAYVEAVKASKGTIEDKAVIRNTPRVENVYVGRSAVISGATLVKNTTILSGDDEKTECIDGAWVRDSILQWGSEVASMASVDSSLLTEHTHVERHGKVTQSILGPNTGVAEGEVTASLCGPFVGFHHQSLLIAAFWPEGKGNVGYGANVGSNHTSKAPDQEIWPGEGTFFGLGVNIKFPSDFTKAPYCIIASGVAALPQKVTFPFSLVNSPATPGADEAGDYAIRGRDLLLKGEYDKALADYNQALRLKPDYAEAYNGRGAAWRSKGEHGKAFADFNEAIRLRPNFSMAYKNRGNAWSAKGEYANAFADFDQAIRLQPDYAEAYYFRGLSWSLYGENDAAIADYDTALKLKPDYPEAYFSRGMLWGVEGMHDKALADLNQTIRLKPDYAEAYCYRAFAWVTKGEEDKALADLQQTVRLQPSNAVAYKILAVIQATCPDARYRDGQAAVMNAKQACRLLNDHWGCLEILAAAYAESGDFAAAKQWQAKAIELAPEKEKVVLRSRLELYQQNKPFRLDLKQPSSAQSSLDQSLAWPGSGASDNAGAGHTNASRLKPRLAEIHINLGVAYASRGRFDKAVAEYTLALQLDPQRADAYFHRGVAYGEKGQPDQALADFGEALRLDPKLAKAFRERGVVYVSKGEFDRALADYSEAVRLDLKDAKAYFHRSRLYGMKGETSNAQTDSAQAEKLGLNSK